MSNLTIIAATGRDSRCDRERIGACYVVYLRIADTFPRDGEVKRRHETAGTFSWRNAHASGERRVSRGTRRSRAGNAYVLAIASFHSKRKEGKRKRWPRGVSHAWKSARRAISMVITSRNSPRAAVVTREKCPPGTEGTGEKSAIICCHLSYLLMDDSGGKKKTIKNSRRRHGQKNATNIARLGRIVRR